MQTLYRVTCIPTLTVWCVLTFSEKYKKEKWQKPWDGKTSWQKWLPQPRMELIQETFQSWKLRKHWHEFLLKDAFGAFISQYFAVYLRYKADPSVLFSLAFWSQSRSVCSEVLKWAWLDWSITGFWEHRVKVTRKYSVFLSKPDLVRVFSRGHMIGMKFLMKFSKSPKLLTLILGPISGWWGHRSPRRTGKVNTTVKMLHCPPGCSCLDNAEFSRGPWQCFRLTF